MPPGASSTAEPAPEAQGCPTSVQSGARLWEAIDDLLDAAAILSFFGAGLLLLARGEIFRGILVMMGAQALSSFARLVKVLKHRAAASSTGTIQSWGGKS